MLFGLTFPPRKTRGSAPQITNADMESNFKYPDEPFLLPSFHPRVILPNRVMDEVRKLPEDQLSLRKEIFNNMHGKYTELGAEHPLGVSAIKNDLTNNIGRMLPELQDETIFALEQHIGATPEWTQVFLYKKFMSISALINGRMFVGLPMSRNPDWIELCLKYTMDLIEVIKAVSITKFFIGPLVHLVAPFLPQVRQLQHDKRCGSQILKPAIEAVAKAREQNAVGSSDSSQFNLTSWILNQMDVNENIDTEIVANEQLFAGIYILTPTINESKC